MLLIGHRGCAYDGYNQNTIRAFRRVLSEGVSAIEFDVQATRDKELYILHNLDLTQVSTGTGLVGEHDGAYIRTLFAGDPRKNEDTIPALEEVLDLLEEFPQGKRPVLHLELKGPGPGNPAGALVRRGLDDGRFAPENFLVSSFRWEELDYFQVRCPEIHVALLAGAIDRDIFEKSAPGSGVWIPRFFAFSKEKFMLPRREDPALLEEDLREHGCPPSVATAIMEISRQAWDGAFYGEELFQAARSRRAVSLNLWHRSITAEVVQKAHAQGLRVLAYTVNDIPEAERLNSLGVDGIFTDFYADLRHLPFLTP